MDIASIKRKILPILQPYEVVRAGLFGSTAREEVAKASDSEFYEEDAQLQDSVLRRLEIIGEAVKNITDEVGDHRPDIP